MKSSQMTAILVHLHFCSFKSVEFLPYNSLGKPKKWIKKYIFQQEKKFRDESSTYTHLILWSQTCPGLVGATVVEIGLRYFNIVVKANNFTFFQFLYRRTKTQLHGMSTKHIISYTQPAHICQKNFSLVTYLSQ